MNPESPPDEYGAATLFPELTAAQRLGFYTESRLDLGANYGNAAAMLKQLNEAAEPYMDGDGYDWHIVASQLDENNARLAWVEWRMRDRGRHEDHNYYLKARDAAGKLRVWEIETVNPHFGCSVQSLAWQDDDVVLVYADKHAAWETRFGPNGQIHRQEAASTSNTRLHNQELSKTQARQSLAPSPCPLPAGEGNNSPLPLRGRAGAREAVDPTAFQPPESGSTEVACQLTPADIQAVHEALFRPAWGARHWGRHESWRRVLAGMALITLVALLIKLFARNKLGADIVGWDMVAGAMLGGALIGLWWARQNTTVPPADSPIYQPFTLSIDPTGFRVQGEGFDNRTGWNQVTALREVGDYMLIETRLGGSHIVPRSAFASPAAASAFTARAAALHARTG